MRFAIVLGKKERLLSLPQDCLGRLLSDRNLTTKRDYPQYTKNVAHMVGNTRSYSHHSSPHTTFHTSTEILR